MTFTFGDAADLTPKEARCLSTFLGWPPRMRRAVADWLATLPNHGGALRMPPLQKAAALAWWRKEFLRSQPLNHTIPCSDPSPSQP